MPLNLISNSLRGSVCSFFVCVLLSLGNHSLNVSVREVSFVLNLDMVSAALFNVLGGDLENSIFVAGKCDLKFLLTRLTLGKPSQVEPSDQLTVLDKGVLTLIDLEFNDVLVVMRVCEHLFLFAGNLHVSRNHDAHASLGIKSLVNGVDVGKVD